MPAVELMPEDCYRPSHKTILVAMSAMYESSIPIDSISHIDYLNSIDKLEAVGGEAYVLELRGNTLALANWQQQDGIVRRDAMLREIIGATNQISALSYDAPIDTKEVIDRAESMLLSVTAREVKRSYRELGDFMSEAYQEAEEGARAGGDVHGAPTGDRGALKGLPNNIDAEAKVLSAMLLSGEVVEEALVELMPDDFYRPSHKTSFVAMSAM